jgi:hypothetical protein
MAQWSPADIELVRQAVLALASGQRAVTVSYAGPPQRSVTYGTADLSQLRSLLAEMTTTAAAVAGQGYRLAATRKGV